MQSRARGSTLATSFADINVVIHCRVPELMSLVERNFSDMKSPLASPAHRLVYEILDSDNNTDYTVSRQNSDFCGAFTHPGDLIYLLEGDLVVQLQLRRKDLLFLHAAALGANGASHILVGRSGAGKSTTCWGLLHHGFGYLSDELAPVAMDSMKVTPYSHALCMKSRPPSEYPIPDAACETGRGFHIPPSAMPTPAVTASLPVKTLLFVEYQPTNTTSTLIPIGAAEAATRLYPNILNALAHDNEGLDASIKLAQRAQCFRLDAGPLRSSCELVAALI